MGTIRCDAPVSLSWIFKVQQNIPDATITAALFVTVTLSLREGIPGRLVTHAEKKTLPGSFVGISRSFWVTPMICPRGAYQKERFRHQVLELKPDARGSLAEMGGGSEFKDYSHAVTGKNCIAGNVTRPLN